MLEGTELRNLQSSSDCLEVSSSDTLHCTDSLYLPTHNFGSLDGLVPPSRIERHTTFHCLPKMLGSSCPPPSCDLVYQEWPGGYATYPLVIKRETLHVANAFKGDSGACLGGRCNKNAPGCLFLENHKDLWPSMGGVHFSCLFRLDNRGEWISRVNLFWWVKVGSPWVVDAKTEGFFCETT